jgi:hypothetical protein
MVMDMYKGGTRVEKGLYWSPLDGRHLMARGESILPGTEDNRFLKISPVILLIIAPLFGMMFVIFLPLFGIGVFLLSWLVPVIGTISAIAITGIRINSGIGGKSAHFNWNPSRSYFSGARKKGKTSGRNKAGISGTRKGGN